MRPDRGTVEADGRRPQSDAQLLARQRGPRVLARPCRGPGRAAARGARRARRGGGAGGPRRRPDRPLTGAASPPDDPGRRDRRRRAVDRTAVAGRGGEPARSVRRAGQQPLPRWLCAGRGQLPRRCSPGCGPASWWPAPPWLLTRDSPRPGSCRASSGLRRASSGALLGLGGRQNAPPSWRRRT